VAPDVSLDELSLDVGVGAVVAAGRSGGYLFDGLLGFLQLVSLGFRHADSVGQEPGVVGKYRPDSERRDDFFASA
jgi:hypothetical protein